MVVSGRRRVGKTRLLLEWVKQEGGVYTVADESSPVQQRVATALSLARVFPGFADVTYPNWQSLLERLSQSAKAISFRGPIIFDELPYLVAQSPELPSVLQKWIDHGVKEARLTVAIAGSSQRMMQGLVLDANAPLYGRATEHLRLAPLPPGAVTELGVKDVVEATKFFTAWGGVPRYWELAESLGRDTIANVLDLVLDPQGPLHMEPTRLLLEELPPAPELKSLLDAIGSGAHRASEIAARTGKPATSLSRPFDRLLELDLIVRETPFGENANNSKRSLYRIRDPFLRLWFRVVSANRAALVGGNRRTRQALLEKHWTGLLATCWEDISRQSLGHLPPKHGLAETVWAPAQRWWHGNAPEWDAAAQDVQEKHLLVAESKWSEMPFTLAQLTGLVREVARKPLPPVGAKFKYIERALCIPTCKGTVPEKIEGVWIVSGRDVFSKPPQTE